MSRKSARENAFRLVYEYLETGERNDFTKELLCADDVPSDSAFTAEIYDAVLGAFDFLKSVIERYSKDFAFDRIYKTDLACLLIAACELLLRADVPEKVSVNEALELSRTYSTEKSGAFINGILASVIANKEQLKEEWKNECESD
ncbi:MAG: transcription antitermination factor NusB [Clostridiales bacterium]|nr:transcription antitermination factor NusB [Clostridiales bacterium]